jgi:hypothetical protein
MLALIPHYNKDAAAKCLSPQQIKKREMEVHQACVGVIVCELKIYSNAGGEVDLLCPDGKVCCMNIIMLCLALDHEATENHCLKAAKGYLSCSCPEDSLRPVKRDCRLLWRATSAFFGRAVRDSSSQLSTAFQARVFRGYGKGTFTAGRMLLLMMALPFALQVQCRISCTRSLQSFAKHYQVEDPCPGMVCALKFLSHFFTKGRSMLLPLRTFQSLPNCMA